MTTWTMERTVRSGAPTSETPRRDWAGRGLTTLAVLFLVFDGATKVMNIEPVREAMADLGYADGLAPGIGLLLLVCVALHLIPRTSVLGAVLLTAFLGGAVASQVRVGNPLLSHALFPVYLALVLWGGLYLREPWLRALLLLRRLP